MSYYKPKKKRRPYYTEHQVLVHKVRYMADHDWSLEEIVCELHMTFTDVQALLMEAYPEYLFGKD